MQALLISYRIGHWIYTKKVPIIPKLIYFLNYVFFNCSLPCSVRIGGKTKFAYGGIGIVIHRDAIIGKNCIIGQGITIGGRSKQPKVPVIGNNVYLGAGSRILGPITIGSNVIVAPNAVVITDVPDGCIVGGIPAKILREGIKIEDYV